MKTLTVCAILLLPAASVAQSLADNAGAQTQKSKRPRKGTAAEVGSGVGTTASGVARGAGSAAVGVAKGAGDLVTLHPIDAGAAVGKGAAHAGKDVTVGTAKGVGKIGKGIGHALRKIF